jgi:hypothetical protein
MGWLLEKTVSSDLHHHATVLFRRRMAEYKNWDANHVVLRFVLTDIRNDIEAALVAKVIVHKDRVEVVLGIEGIRLQDLGR